MRMFQGRLNRRDFLIGVVFLIGIYLASFAFLKASERPWSLICNDVGENCMEFKTLEGPHLDEMLSEVLFSLVSILFIPLYLIMAIRRLHDIDKSGWFSLIILTVLSLKFSTQPVVWCSLFTFSLFFLLVKGTSGPNRFGKPESYDWHLEKILFGEGRRGKI